MTLLAIDIGGTKIAAALFSEEGIIVKKEKINLQGRKGKEVSTLIAEQVNKFIEFARLEKDPARSIGLSVPGIYYSDQGRVWAPNIPGWDSYPLLEEIKTISEGIPVTIDSDRACHMLGEVWMGNARGCKDAIFIAVGTGIGAGILVNGEILRGSRDIAGSIGWMALNKPFRKDYVDCGCFEYHASGAGIAKVTREYLEKEDEYRGELRGKIPEGINSHDVLSLFTKGDKLCKKVIEEAIEYWGMAVANLVSIFNPEKIIFGGGLFGPAKSLLPSIKSEAMRWAQPISIRQLEIENSALQEDAGLYGCAYLALKNYSKFNT
ncbi:MAG: ROK family protein [Bacteroidota bacterium]